MKKFTSMTKHELEDAGLLYEMQSKNRSWNSTISKYSRL